MYLIDKFWFLSYQINILAIFVVVVKTIKTNPIKCKNHQPKMNAEIIIGCTEWNKMTRWMDGLMLILSFDKSLFFFCVFFYKQLFTLAAIGNRRCNN